MTLAYSVGADLFVGHIGDSRAHLVRGGKVQQLTRDQTLAQRLIDTHGLRREETASLEAALARAASAEDACRALIDLALDRGGEDNVTVALTRYRFPHKAP